MRKAFIRMMLVAGLAVTASACDSLLESRDHLYDGPPTIEFAPVLPAGSYSLSVSLEAGSTADQMATVRVNYIGPPPSSAVNGTIAVTEESTAVEDTHFTFPGEYTIAAGENFADVPVTIHGGALENGEEVNAVFELENGADFEVSENYSRFTIEISKAGGS